MLLFMSLSLMIGQPPDIGRCRDRALCGAFGSIGFESNKRCRCVAAPAGIREQIAIEIVSVYLFGICSGDLLVRPQIDAASVTRSADVAIILA